MGKTNETQPGDAVGPPAGVPVMRPRIGFDLRLRSLKSSRQTLARVLREYGRGTIDEGTFKALLYGMNIFLGFLRESSAEELEQRLKALEGKLESIEKGNGYDSRRIS